MQKGILLDVVNWWMSNQQLLHISNAIPSRTISFRIELCCAIFFLSLYMSDYLLLLCMLGRQASVFGVVQMVLIDPLPCCCLASLLINWQMPWGQIVCRYTILHLIFCRIRNVKWNGIMCNGQVICILPATETLLNGHLSGNAIEMCGRWWCVEVKRRYSREFVDISNLFAVMLLSLYWE